MLDQTLPSTTPWDHCKKRPWIIFKNISKLIYYKLIYKYIIFKYQVLRASSSMNTFDVINYVGSWLIEYALSILMSPLPNWKNNKK